MESQFDILLGAQNKVQNCSYCAYLRSLPTPYDFEEILVCIFDQKNLKQVNYTESCEKFKFDKKEG